MSFFRSKLGIFGLVLVFGFGLLMTSCEMEEQPPRLQLSVTNMSTATIDVVIIERRSSDQESNLAAHSGVLPQVSTPRTSAIPGYYRVEVRTDGLVFHYPLPARTFRRMEGHITLWFDGNQMTTPRP